MTRQGLPGSAGPAISGPVGLLGGSFDPVHAGHMQLARDAQASLGLAQLRLLPAGHAWQKGPMTPAYHRAAMLRLAVAGALPPGAQWQVDTREIDRGGPSYTVDTLRELRAALGPAIPMVWIMGYDQLRGLPSWHEWRSLADLAHVAYARRAGTSPALDADIAAYVGQRRGTAAQLAAAPAGLFVEFPMQAVDCSATRIRDALAAGDPSRAVPFLAPAVLGYIQSHQLYLAVHGQ